jgi:hypothetical protein
LVVHQALLRVLHLVAVLKKPQAVGQRVLFNKLPMQPTLNLPKHWHCKGGCTRKALLDNNQDWQQAPTH